MEVVDAIVKRRSVRSYYSDPIDDKIIKKLILYANLAPSAGNLQARDFVVVKDEKLKRDIAKAAYHQDFIAEAPVVIVVCANINRIKRYGTRGKNLYIYLDAGAAVENLMLMAVAYGLATCWIGSFDGSKIEKLLNLPSYLVPITVMPIGKAKEHPLPRGRLPLNRIYHENKFAGEK
jgi:nitroreductase